MADPRIVAALEAVDRRGFLPATKRPLAGTDRPLAIGHGQTCSQPTTVANMLELLDVHEGHRVLDVGAGSGWTTALLAHLVGPTGRVVGVELVPELAEWGASNVAATDRPWATLRRADPDVLGVPEEGPYDRILVSAGARQVPDELVGQLVDEGVMVVPVASRMLRITRHADGTTTTTTHGAYSFVPLLGPGT